MLIMTSNYSHISLSLFHWNEGLHLSGGLIVVPVLVRVIIGFSIDCELEAADACGNLGA
jgi:hypothetical protein